MATEFGSNMMAQMEEYKAALAAKPEIKTHGENRTPSIEYKCEASGIDLVVSRISSGKCTMQMFVYLSQPDEEGNGTIFIKTVRGGAIKPGTVDTISSFLQNAGSDGVITGSNVIPRLSSGKDFAQQLYSAKGSHFVELAKEGLINTEILKKYSCAPWYYNMNGWRSSRGYGIEDRHPKLMRYMIDAMAKKYRRTYADVLTGVVNDSITDSGAPWCFSMFADVFDEPFAKKCFDEYIDNERLYGMDHRRLFYVFRELSGAKGYEESWKTIVEAFKKGTARCMVDKNRFWEYIQQSIGMGLGRRIGQFFNLYSDYIHQAYICDKVIRDKYPAHLQEAHDIYTEKFSIIQEFRQKQGLEAQSAKGQRIIDQVHDGWQLKTLMTVNEFYEEAQQNCNCVASYVQRAVDGKCWIASFRPKDADTTVLTVEVDPSGVMVQVKGKYNREPTAKEKELLKTFQAGIYKKMEEEVKKA